LLLRIHGATVVFEAGHCSGQHCSGDNSNQLLTSYPRPLTIWEQVAQLRHGHVARPLALSVKRIGGTAQEVEELGSLFVREAACANGELVGGHTQEDATSRAPRGLRIADTRKYRWKYVSECRVRDVMPVPVIGVSVLAGTDRFPSTKTTFA
jgi:hypothetical protein